MASILNSAFEEETFESEKDSPVIKPILIENSDDDREENEKIIEEIKKRKVKDVAPADLDKNLRKILRVEDEKDLGMSLNDLKEFIFATKLRSVNLAKQEVKDFKKILEQKAQAKKPNWEKISDIFDKICYRNPNANLSQSNDRLRKANEARKRRAKEMFYEALLKFDNLSPKEKELFMSKQKRNEQAIMKRNIKYIKSMESEKKIRIEKKQAEKKSSSSSSSKETESDNNDEEGEEFDNPMDESSDE